MGGSRVEANNKGRIVSRGGRKGTKVLHQFPGRLLSTL